MKKKTVPKIEIQEDNYADASLKIWQEHFEKIYGKKNDKLTPEYVWARVYENGSKVAENLRRYKYAAAFQSLTHVLCWVFGFATRVGKNLEDVVWAKYPYICPYCRKEKGDVLLPCSCGTHRVQLEEAHSYVKERMIRQEMMEYFAKAFADKRPSKLDDWVLMYEKLYGNVTYSIPIEHLGFHLMEEIGEVSRVLRRKGEFEKRIAEGLETGTDITMAKQQFELDLDAELADVFSWTCTLVHKIRSLASALKDFQDHIKSMESGVVLFRIQPIYAKATNITVKIPEATFASVLYWEYGEGCPSCGSIPCSEDCFLRECKFMNEGGKCSFDWGRENRCPYGKLFDPSEKCNQI